MSTVKELVVELAALRAEFEAFKEQVAVEVRTRRLVVVSESGREGITTKVTDTDSEITVAAPGADDLGGSYIGVLATADNGCEGDLAHAEVLASSGDDSYAWLASTRHQGPDGMVAGGELFLDRTNLMRGEGGKYYGRSERSLTARADGIKTTCRGDLLGYAQIIAPPPAVRW